MHTKQRVGVPDFEEPVFTQRKDAVGRFITDDKIFVDDLCDSIGMGRFT
jgi:hypothetical protein